MINEGNLRAVRRYLLSLQAAEGAKLPTERAMAQTLELSRGAVREALSVMESEGHIVRKIGSGTYMAKKEDTTSPGATPSLDATPGQIVEARIAFEPYIAGLAAMNGRKRDMERLMECAEAYHRADDFDTYEIADENFHAAITAATHNPVLISAYQAFTDAHAAAEWGGLRQRFLTKERRVASRREHDRILDAIRNRDSEAATTATRHHLKCVTAALLSVS